MSTVVQQPKSKKNSVITIMLMLVMFVFLVLMIWLFSSVRGTEFSPTHFQKRTFEFGEVPLLGWQLSKITRTSTTDSTSQYLVANKLITVPSNAAERWDLVRINRMFVSNNDADTSILTTYLQGTGGSRVNWEQWSRDNPKAAAVFWPFVQDLAINRLYLLVPRAFEITENETDPVKLKTALDNYLVEELPEFANDLNAAGYSDIAVSALENAIKSYPGNKKLEAVLVDLSAPAP